MTVTSNYIASITFSMLRYKNSNKKHSIFSISAQQTEVQEIEQTKPEVASEETINPKQSTGSTTPLRPVEKQTNVKSKNMGRDYGSQWLSSITRHVRIYAAYIDPETCAFDQTQTDKLTLILDPTEEFLWNDETCNMVYSHFQELVDHYARAPLSEYTLRLIGLEHYIRKLLYQGQIQYNMDAKQLNFSMGKPRVGFGFNYDDQI